MKWLTECRKPNEMSALLPFKKITYTTAGHLCRNYIQLARTSQKISPLILRRGPSWRTSPRSCRRLSEINVPGAPVTCNTPAAAPAEGNQRRLPPTLSSSIMTSSHNVHTSQKPFEHTLKTNQKTVKKPLMFFWKTIKKPLNMKSMPVRFSYVFLMKK